MVHGEGQDVIAAGRVGDVTEHLAQRLRIKGRGVGVFRANKGGPANCPRCTALVDGPVAQLCWMAPLHTNSACLQAARLGSGVAGRPRFAVSSSAAMDPEKSARPQSR